jgi:ornithine cyclodeaminase/alanine dehydrogenase-like protein (mu-crystallin family)
MLFISNEDVQKVLTIEDTLRVLERGHRELARGELASRPRVDIYTETSDPRRFHRWGTMEGASKGLHRFAIRMKSDVVSWPRFEGRSVEEKYCVRPGLFCGLIFLFDTESGEPLALINDGHLQHLRVGASAGLAVKYLARKEAAVVGMLGSGGMARSHLIAFAAVRKIKKAKVFSPDREHRELYAREMAEKLGCELVPCNSPDEAAKGADILSTCTNSIRPTLFGRMVAPGMHLTSVASEYAEDVYPKIDLCIGGGPLSQLAQGIPIDSSRGFTTYLAGSMEALQNARGEKRPRDGRPDFRARVIPLIDLIEGRAEGRRNEKEISASGSLNIGKFEGHQGLQFVTVASLIYDGIKKAGLGREVPLEWFLQDIRD